MHDRSVRRRRQRAAAIRAARRTAFGSTSTALFNVRTLTASHDFRQRCARCRWHHRFTRLCVRAHRTKRIFSRVSAPASPDISSAVAAHAWSFSQSGLFPLLAGNQEYHHPWGNPAMFSAGSVRVICSEKATPVRFAS